MRRALLAVGAAAVMSLGLMAQATLISDLRTSLSAQDTSPTPGGALEGNIWAKAREWRRIGAESFFFAQTVYRGTSTYIGLYATMGSTASTRLVSDLRVGRFFDVGELVSTGRRLFFLARGNQGLELRVSDGTSAGTMALNCSGRPDGCLAPLGKSGSIIFRGYDATLGYALYASDGTSAGTRFVLDIDSSSTGTSDHILHAVPFGLDKSLFIANDGTHGSELWITDGTSAGTRMLKDIDLGASSGLSSSSALLPVGGKVFFTASEGTHGQELWITDGTAAGTQLVKDIVPGSANGKIELRHAASMGGKLYFGASDGTAMGKALWTSDGTASGTQILSSVNPAQNPTSSNHLVTCGQRIFFCGYQAASGIELWVTDGTTAGTRMVADMVPGSNSSGPRLFTPVGNGSSCAFTAFTPASGVELFISDGTAAGTTLLKDIAPGTNSCDPLHLGASANGMVLFAADTGTSKEQLWATDGTTVGTQEIYSAFGPAAASSQPRNAVTLWNSFFFAADDGVAGEEPYLAYPQINSIKMIRDLYPGSSSAGGSYPCRLGNEVLFAASGYLNYVLTGRELYVTDGTSQGTRLLKDIRPGTSSSSPSHLTRWRGKIYFGANDGTHGSELWVSDGTAAGTTLLKDINPGSANGSPYSFAATDKLLFFRANGGTSTGYELWKTDGTAAGTQLVKDINPGSESSYAGELEAYGDSVYFSAKLASTGFELWKSDGTAAGTVLVKDIQPGSADGDPEHLVVWQGLLWFRADDGVHGEELWVSDGSSAGTRLFADIWPGATSSGVGYLTPCGSRHLYFRADDGTGKGIELWRSDGTVAGTQLATEIRPGPAGANPYLDYSEGSQSRFLVLWGDVIFGADDGLHARELWKYRNGATAQAIGEGFAPHTRALPTLRSEDPLLGATINVEGSLSSGPNSVAITLFGIPDYSPMRLLPSEDAWSYLDLGLPFWVWNVSAANAQKRFSFQVGIPNDPHLMGLRTVLQSWVLGTDGPRGFDLSNGVSWWIGT